MYMCYKKSRQFGHCIEYPRKFWTIGCFLKVILNCPGIIIRHPIICRMTVKNKMMYVMSFRYTCSLKCKRKCVNVKLLIEHAYLYVKIAINFLISKEVILLHFSIFNIFSILNKYSITDVYVLSEFSSMNNIL